MNAGFIPATLDCAICRISPYRFLLVFGLIFEVPLVITPAGCWLGGCSIAETLSRKWAFLTAFIFAAIHPDTRSVQPVPHGTAHVHFL